MTANYYHFIAFEFTSLTV